MEGTTTAADALVALTAKLHATWSPHHQVEGELLLYHYTTAAGLIGIAGNKTIFATHANYLNDPLELLHAKGVISAAVGELPFDPQDRVAARFRDMVVEGVDRTLKNDDYYVACFCENADLLSQWRAYSNAGGGYAIGLDANDLRTKEAKNVLLRRVIYDRRVQFEIVSALLDGALAAIRSRPEAELHDLVDVLLGVLLECLCTFKDDAFKAEEEWRLFMRGARGGQYVVEFRPSGGIVVPYTQFDLHIAPGRTALREVVVGPTVSPIRSATSLAVLMKFHDLTGLTTRASRIPLAF